MAKINERGLPLNFTAKHLFPEEWPKIDRAGQHRTPPQHSLQWRAIVDFRESESWKEGDLKRLADYFGVNKSTLSEKIKKSLIDRNSESSRKVLANKPECRQRNKPSSLKDAPVSATSSGAEGAVAASAAAASAADAAAYSAAAGVGSAHAAAAASAAAASVPAASATFAAPPPAPPPLPPPAARGGCPASGGGGGCGAEGAPAVGLPLSSGSEGFLAAPAAAASAATAANDAVGAVDTAPVTTKR